MTPMRQCTKCKQEYPATPEHFSRHGSGLRPDCKKCRQVTKSQYYQKNREKAAAYAKTWNEANRERKAAMNKSWRERNPEKDQEYRRRYRAENKHKNTEYMRKWRESHREQYNSIDREYRSRNRHRVRLLAKAARARDPLRFRVYQSNRRALELAAGSYTRNDVQKMLIQQDHKCQWCSQPLDEGFHVDHVIPLTRGGANTVDNLVVTCQSCNLRKSNRIPYLEWQPPCHLHS